MYQKNAPNFGQYPLQIERMDKQVINPNKTLSWSSINSNYQQSISPLNYKVSNPSSSLIMSSLSHIREDDVETTGSSVMYQKGKGSSRGDFKKKKQFQDSHHNDFYRFLIEEAKSEKQIQGSFHSNMNNMQAGSQFISSERWPKREGCIENEAIAIDDEQNIPKEKGAEQRQNFTLMNEVSGCSVQESLQQLQQSQEELSFLKFKLQEAYEKLQTEILNSCRLEQRVELITAELRAKQEMIQLEKHENQKLKFTLKAIIKNKSLLEDEIQKDQTKKSLSNENTREQELKENLKLKLEIKDLTQKLTHFDKKISELTKQISEMTNQNNAFNQDLKQSKKQTQTLKNQISKKDQYLESLSNQLDQIDSLKNQNKALLQKEIQYLNKINVLQLELRKVTDEKVTSTSRLKHQVALLQKHNEQLLHQNQTLQQHNYLNQSHNQFNAYSPAPVSKRNLNKSSHKYSNNNQPRYPTNHHPMQPPMIFDSEEEDMKNVSQFGQNSYLINPNISIQSNNDSLNVLRKRRSSVNQNKENIQTENMQQSFVNQLNASESCKVERSVGKWKKAQSVSNNLLVYVQGSSNEQQEAKESIKSQQKTARKPNSADQDPVQKIIKSKLEASGMGQSEDQKLSKYQQHRRNLQNQLSALQKVKRPSAQQRQKMEKLEKQLYYVDSDIAGLKRKIRRKY